MVFLKFLLYSVHVIVCIFLILVVLLQRGKGADLSVFGGGSTQTAFGARGATTLLHKLTVGFFVAFIVTTLAIAGIQGGGVSSSVMDEVDAEPAAEAPAEDSGDATAPAEDTDSDSATTEEEAAGTETGADDAGTDAEPADTEPAADGGNPANPES
jgi:preprotein translocase subunit SecG